MVAKKRAEKHPNIKDYEKVGKIMESVFESGFVSQFRVYKINFIRGLFFGLGSVLGGTIIIALLIWFLSFFSELPFIGNFVETVRSTVDQ